MGDPPVTQVNLYKVMVAHDLDDLGYHNFRKPKTSIYCLVICYIAVVYTLGVHMVLSENERYRKCMAKCINRRMMIKQILGYPILRHTMTHPCYVELNYN